MTDGGKTGLGACGAANTADCASPPPVSLFVGLGHLRFFGWKTADVTEKLFRTQPILDWLAYSAEYADGRVFAADTATTGVIGCMTEVAKKRTERPCE